MDDKELEATYLDEMQALERFRIAYAGAHPLVPLHRDDPDVARLLEAIAFFSARSRIAAGGRLDDALLRLFRATFDELLRPIPPTCLLKAASNTRHVEVVELPSETDFVLRRPGQGPIGEDSFYRFTSLRGMRILPASLVGVETIRRGPAGSRIALRFESRFPRQESLGRIPIHINHLGDFAASTTILHAIETNLVGVSVVFDERVTEASVGVACGHHFGEPTLDDARGEAVANSLERERLYFRFPQQAQFIEVTVPRTPPRWTRFTICIDVSPKWPSSLRLSLEMIHMGVVATVNRIHDFAGMIDENGTLLRHPVLAPVSLPGLRPQAVLSVNRITKDGFAPLEHGSIRAAAGGWESMFSGGLGDRRAFVEVAIPGAFEAPERLAVDAFWFQPELNDIDSLDLEVSPASRFIEGLDWSLLSTITKATLSPFERDREAVLRLIAMRQDPEIRTEDLRFLLRFLSADAQPAFARFVEGLSSVVTAVKPFARHASGLKQVVTVNFDGLDGTSIPFLDTFGRALTRVLRAWTPQEVVEVNVCLRNLEIRRSYAP